MPRKITSEEVNKVLEGHFWFGKNSNQAAEAAGISHQVASGIIKTFHLMRAGDIDGLVREAAANEKISAQIVKLVAERIGIDAPEEVIRAILERQQAKAERLRNARAAAPAAEEETPPSPAQAPATPPLAGEGKAAAPGNDAVYFIRILEELHQQNELLRDLLDVVIPKYVGDMKDNVNANCDAMSGILKDQGQQLEAIRCQMRKRGL